MKLQLKAEELLQLIFAIYLNSFLPYDWWLYWLLFLAPDIGFIGYLISQKAGAITYNALHHKGIALLVYIIGIFWGVIELQFIGLLLFGHSAFDRLLGYGLKYPDNFHHTHLGWIGKHSHGK